MTPDGTIALDVSFEQKATVAENAPIAADGNEGCEY
jgi:hypothetical protein